MEADNIAVTVFCVTYNQVEYISKALDSFLMQKTNFDFEVIIHDDASNDGTKEIIEKYVKKYPKIFVPLYENENQYSKGKGEMFIKDMLDMSRGKYLAICEGDDCWISDEKLQKQYDFMETHEDYQICFHNCQIHFENTGQDAYYSFETRTIPHKELILKNTSIVDSTSHFMRIKMYKELFPDVIKNMGDISRILWNAMHGKAYYFGDVMSLYRKNTKGSWSNKYQMDFSFRVECMKGGIELLNQIDSFSNYVDTEIFKEAKIPYYYELISALRHIDDKNSELEVKKYLKELSNISRLAIIKYWFPRMIDGMYYFATHHCKGLYKVYRRIRYKEVKNE